MVSMPGKLGRCGIAAALVVSLGLVAGPAYADETPEPADLSGELLLDEERPSAEFLTDPAEVLAGIEDGPGTMARASAVVTAPPFDHTFVMTDYEFYRADALNATQIQQFIQAKGAACTTTADKTCLKDLVLPVTSLRSDRSVGCKPVDFPAGTRSWTAIDMVAKACGISPKVLLTTIQKESSGVAQAKTPAQWNKMMGMGCPDGGTCSEKFAGFEKQLYFAADRLYAYQTWTTYPFIRAYLGGPPAKPLDAGAEAFVPKSMATASLYTYTPWISSNRLFYTVMKGYFPEALIRDEAPVTLRWGGQDRVDTSLMISQEQWSAATAKKVYIARADIAADAQVAGILTNGPILLTNPRSAAVEVRAEIQRLGNPEIVVVGGTGAVSDAVATYYSGGRAYTRLAGDSRADTSIAVSRYAFPAGSSPRSVYLTDGFGPDGNGGPDGVVGGVLTDGPVLLVNPRSGISPEVRAEIQRLKGLGAGSVFALGGAAVGYPLQGKLFGATRYETAVEIAKRAFPSGATSVYVANGDSFVDAIAGGTVTDGPILLTKPAGQTPEVCAYVKQTKPRRVVALGGVGVVPESTLQAVADCAS